MGAGASAALGAVADEVLPLETAALIIGPVFEPSAVQLVDIPVESAAASGGAGAESPAVASKGVRKANLFSVYGVELPFGDAITAVMFDSDKSRGRCFVELKDTVRNYSGVFRALQRKYAVADAEHGMTRQEFCDMLESVGNEDLDEGMAGGMYVALFKSVGFVAFVQAFLRYAALLFDATINMFGMLTLVLRRGRCCLPGTRK